MGEVEWRRERPPRNPVLLMTPGFRVFATPGMTAIMQRSVFTIELSPNDADFQAHMDYVHINPVKHGLVKAVAQWPHSTFHRLVERGVHSADWAGGNEERLEYSD